MQQRKLTQANLLEKRLRNNDRHRLEHKTIQSEGEHVVKSLYQHVPPARKISDWSKQQQRTPKQGTKRWRHTNVKQPAANWSHLEKLSKHKKSKIMRKSATKRRNQARKSDKQTLTNTMMPKSTPTSNRQSQNTDEAKNTDTRRRDTTSSVSWSRGRYRN